MTIVRSHDGSSGDFTFHTEVTRHSGRTPTVVSASRLFVGGDMPTHNISLSNICAMPFSLIYVHHIAVLMLVSWMIQDLDNDLSV